MKSWSEFFEMGGYAAFVWPAYIISIAALLALFVLSWRWMVRAERMAEASKIVSNATPQSNSVIRIK